LFLERERLGERVADLGGIPPLELRECRILQPKRVR
jgi:hypothetical protein